MGLLVLVVIGVAFAIWLRRATELFKLSIAPGSVRLTRGRIPPSLLREIRDVFAGSKASGTVSVVHDRGEARVVTHGIPDGSSQQVRNVVGRYPLARLRAAGKPGRRA